MTETNNPNTSRNIVTQIVEKYHKSLPFGELKSRMGVALVLSYFGDSEKVYKLMQCTSHRSRAYIFNAKGLKGFLVPGIIAALKEAQETGSIEYATKYQSVNIKAVL